MVRVVPGMGNGTEVLLQSIRDHSEQDAAGAQAPQSGIGGLTVLVAALAPAVAAVWTTGWFVTQDGPAHVYNAQVLAWSFDRNSPFRTVYTIQWQPIPNWAGHLALAGLVTACPAWVADRIMTSVTLVGFAAATLWLRWRVAGTSGMRVAALLAALLAMNLAWLLGFSSFLLGACLFPITLGIWWRGRDCLSIARIAALSALLILGYFCHLVSLGLTVVGLGVLSVASPLEGGSNRSWRPRFARLARTSISFTPLVVLGFFYARISRQGGPMHPVWGTLSDPRSPLAWGARLGWVDPLTLATKYGLPLTERVGTGFILFAPVVWLSVALVLWWYGRITVRQGILAWQPAGGSIDRQGLAVAPAGTGDARQGWNILAALLIVAGVAGPDSLGPTHGEFLPQRLVLLGLVALVPVFDVNPSRWSGLATVAALVAAVVLQSAIVWDYARYSDRTAGQIIGAGDLVGRNQRIVTLLVRSHGRFRANPMLHAENWLGVDTGNVVWNNYETLHYYFPVQFEAGIERPHPGDLELVSLHEDDEGAMGRLRDWERILAEHADSIDVVVMWKSDERLEGITKRWFDLEERRGDVQVFRRNRSRSRQNFKAPARRHLTGCRPAGGSKPTKRRTGNLSVWESCGSRPRLYDKDVRVLIFTSASSN